MSSLERTFGIKPRMPVNSTKASAEVSAMLCLLFCVTTLATGGWAQDSAPRRYSMHRPEIGLKLFKNVQSAKLIPEPATVPGTTASWNVSRKASIPAVQIDTVDFALFALAPYLVAFFEPIQNLAFADFVPPVDFKAYADSQGLMCFWLHGIFYTSVDLEVVEPPMFTHTRVDLNGSAWTRTTRIPKGGYELAVGSTGVVLKARRPRSSGPADAPDTLIVFKDTLPGEPLLYPKRRVFPVGLGVSPPDTDKQGIVLTVGERVIRLR